MNQNKLNLQLFVLQVVLISRTIVECKTTTPFLEKIHKLSYFRSTAKIDIKSKNSHYSKANTIFNSSDITKMRVKKWQVGRVSRKHYEIVNMLWRKAKTSFGVTPKDDLYFKRRNDSRKNMDYLSFHTFIPRPILPASTPSFIEFYYLDETDDLKNITPTKYVKYDAKSKKESPVSKIENFRFESLNPVLRFNVFNITNYKRSLLPTRYMHPTYRMHQRKPRTYISSIENYKPLNSLTPPYSFPQKQKQKTGVNTTSSRHQTENLTFIMTVNILSPNRTVPPTSTNFVDNETCAYTTEHQENFNSIENGSLNMLEIQPTTIYDKIKFFELYDRNTYKPGYPSRKYIASDEIIEVSAYGNEINNYQKNLLEHVNLNIGHDHDILHKIKHAKKHIIENNKEEDDHKSFIEKTLNIKPVLFTFKNKTTTVKEKNLNNVPELGVKSPKYLKHNMSMFTSWSTYPFAAVYIFEPLQVYCDAASISQHWLITAGSCLSRHHKKPEGTGRSAYVSYCGESWWNPERIAYVKYSVVHPRYHPGDETRRHLYNVGLIQVVSSMSSACAGWSPISLMSHQLISDDEGSKGIAVGWGLNRFNTQYQSTNLPKLPLSVYESSVYSNSCPGNVQYSKTKRLEENGGIRNVYCLSLPPYCNEENDPVHGGLLLIGGKLIALYLQEERRPWGEQCAQYTGTWRLIPWVLDVAHEPNDIDLFTIDI